MYVSLRKPSEFNGSQYSLLNRRERCERREPIEYRLFWCAMSFVHVVSGKPMRSNHNGV